MGALFLFFYFSGPGIQSLFFIFLFGALEIRNDLPL
jgi:hypothetical protein